jgi:hypothetical protein
MHQERSERVSAIIEKAPVKGGILLPGQLLWRFRSRRLWENFAGVAFVFASRIYLIGRVLARLNYGDYCPLHPTRISLNPLRIEPI